MHPWYVWVYESTRCTSILFCLLLYLYANIAPHTPHTPPIHKPTPPPLVKTPTQQATLASLQRAIAEETTTLTRLQQATEAQRAEVLHAAADLEQMQAQVECASEALQARVAAVGCLEAALERGCRQLDEMQVRGWL